MTDWRHMETLPSKEMRVMFWLDWAEDCARLNPPLHDFDYVTRLFIGKYGCWGSTYKATAWALLPEPPALAIG